MVLAGRTDAGVHAEGQVASVRTVATESSRKLTLRLQACLAPDLSLVSLADAPVGFDARRSACWRAYRYEFEGQGTYLDLARAQEAGGVLVGEHDFSAYSSMGELGPRGSVRRVLDLRVAKNATTGLVLMEIVADAFLRQMVRRVVSALVAVGNGIMGTAEILRGLELRDRGLLPGPAPASGLTLVQVGYREYAR